MLKRLRMDMHRLPKGLAFKIILILLLGEFTLTAFAFSFMMSRADDMGELFQMMGITGTTMTAPMFLKLTLGQLGDFAMYMAIYVVLFSNGDFHSGFIKSVAGQVRTRSMLGVSKFITVAVYTVFYFFASILISVIELAIFFDGPKDIGTGEFWQYALLLLFMYLAMSVSIAAVAQFFRSNLIGIISGVAISIGLISSILSLVNVLIKKLGFEVDLAEYTITGSIKSLGLEGSLGDYSQHIIVCTVYMIVAVAAALISYNKRDIA